MGESEGSVFWDGKEDEYGGSFMSANFHSNQCFEPGIHSIYDEESGSKRIRLSPESSQQEGDADSSSQSSPLGLTLRKTPSFLSLLQSSLSKQKHAGLSKSSQDHDKSKTKMDDLGSHQSMAEKLKASNFPAVFLKIGSWQRFTRHEGDLTAKLYYAKRKLVWEVLDGALKSKIEIQWSDIIAIRAITPENEAGTLEIELNQPPLFYREINPQPRKHTLWQQASDFTGGQAPIWRRHQVTFQPGILDKHYEKLLQCDKRLLGLSQKPFPCHESPYFDPTMFGLSELSLSFNRYGSGVQYPYQTYPRTPPLRLAPNPSLPVMDSTFRGSSNHFVSQQPTHWPSHLTSESTGNQVFHGQNYYQPNLAPLNDIENHLLGDQPHAVPSDLRAKVGSMDSLLVTTDVNPSFDANHLGKDNMFGADEGMQNARDTNPTIDGAFSQQVNLLPPPHELYDTMVMEQAMTNSLPAFLFLGNSTGGDFFDL